MKRISLLRHASAVTLPFLYGLFLIAACGNIVWGKSMTYDHIEAIFPLPDLPGNPFDYTENDVKVTFRLPDGKSATVLAFFDGDTKPLWKARYTPRSPGEYTLIRITRNGVPMAAGSLPVQKFSVAKSAPAHPGFVRRDLKNAHRFRFENGDVYYPMGANIAWGSQGLEVPALLTKLGRSGGNWSRIWMNHWDGKNLDWVMDAKNTPGRLDLNVARRWDGIVDAAEKSGIHFQLVLQHHGQYSTATNPNWEENPWNVKNGGFLQLPEEFFTNVRARALTKAKYRYIIARWGYSPSILAWELFNEVQFVDALRNKTPEGHAAVIAWHKEMAAFVRGQDTEHHLVTTSSETDISGLYDAVDYVQPHSYPPDAITMAAGLQPSRWNKPIFFGEVGPSGGDGGLDGAVYRDFLHAALWASLMQSDTGGAAQFWYWDQMERQNLYSHYQAASAFLKATGLESLDGMKNISPIVTTVESGAVSLRPGAAWGPAKQTEFVVSPFGEIPGIESLPSFLQGKAHADLFAGARFQVEYARTGTFAVQIRQSAKAGAHLVITLDGKTVAEQDFPAGANDVSAATTVAAQIPAGKHIIGLTNTGADWVLLNRISLSPYGSALKAIGKTKDDHMALWVRRVASGEEGGTITLTPGTLKPGTYQARWWDTNTGKEVSRDSLRVTGGGESITLKTPPISQDVALFVSPG